MIEYSFFWLANIPFHFRYTKTPKFKACMTFLSKKKKNIHDFGTIPKALRLFSIKTV